MARKRKKAYTRINKSTWQEHEQKRFGGSKYAKKSRVVKPTPANRKKIESHATKAIVGGVGTLGILAAGAATRNPGAGLVAGTPSFIYSEYHGHKADKLLKAAPTHNNIGSAANRRGAVSEVRTGGRVKRR